MTSSYSKTFIFVRPKVNEKPAFSKIPTLENVFEKMRFRLPFSRVDGRPNRNRLLPFSNKNGYMHCRIQGRSPGDPSPPLVLDQTHAQRAEKIFFKTTPPAPHLAQGLDDSPPRPLSPCLKVWIRH